MEQSKRRQLYDVMREFAAAGWRREPNERFWRFYEIVARTRNDPNRMTFAEEADIEEICGSRAIAEDRLGRSRMDRYLDSSGDDTGAKRRAPREAKEEAESICLRMYSGFSWTPFRSTKSRGSRGPAERDVCPRVVARLLFWGQPSWVLHYAF